MGANLSLHPQESEGLAPNRPCKGELRRRKFERVQKYISVSGSLKSPGRSFVCLSKGYQKISWTQEEWMDVPNSAFSFGLWHP